MTTESGENTPKKTRRGRTGMDVLHDIAYWIAVLILVAMLIFATNYQGILQALHDYQQPTCKMVK